MDDKVLKIFQEKTLETLKFAIDFFESHNLRYVAYGGTCLGAVRHKGMIPWDDDVDLLMPYEDYQRLLTMQQEINSTGKFALYTPETPGYYDPISRISSTDITLWRYYLNRFVFGTQIDIFPICYTDLEKDEIQKVQDELFEKTYRFQRSNQKYNLDCFLDCIKNKHLRGLLRTAKWALSTKNRDKYLNELHELEATLHNPNGKYAPIYGSFAYGLEVYKAGFFDEYEVVPFHDFTIRIPKNYDAYLKSVFNDYMQLPPEEKRHAGHGGYYVNLKEGLTLEEVRKRMKKGERLVM